MYTKTCNYCGKMFTATRKDAKTCSTKCRVGLSIVRNVNVSDTSSVNTYESVNVSVSGTNKARKQLFSNYKNYTICNFVNEQSSHIRHDKDLFIRIGIWDYENATIFPDFDAQFQDFYLHIESYINDFLMIEGIAEYPIQNNYLNMIYVYVRASQFNYWLYSDTEIQQAVMQFLEFEYEETYDDFCNNSSLIFFEDLNKWAVVDIQGRPLYDI